MCQIAGAPAMALIPKRDKAATRAGEATRGAVNRATAAEAVTARKVRIRRLTMTCLSSPPVT